MNDEEVLLIVESNIFTGLLCGKHNTRCLQPVLLNEETEAQQGI